MTSERISPVWGTILLTITIFSLSLPAYAIYSGGTGRPNDPYQIATAAGLWWLDLRTEDHDKHFILTADIDLDPNLPGPRVFDKALIGNFSGVFDGNGHTISNLTIQGEDDLGLFGQLDPGAEVMDLGVVDVNITGSGRIGGLAGGNGGSITNCYSTGTVIGTGHNVGGLVGGNYGDINASYSTGTVKGTGYKVGGLVGEQGRGSVTDCYSISAVSGNDSVGGLIGYNRGPNNDNHGASVTNCFSVGAVSGNSSVGGLVGSGGGRVLCSVWDIETSGQSVSDGGVGLTTVEMMDPYMLGLNGFANDINWVLDAEGDYPRLAWEGTPGQIIPEPLIDWLEGDGTAEAPYRIDTSGQLIQLSRASTLWDKHFILSADVDLNPNLPGGQVFTSAIFQVFKGVFDGNRHIISNLTITGKSHLGLFGQLLWPNAEVKNIGVVDVNITGSSDYVGGLVGYEDYGTVIHCYSSGVVNGTSSVGGLVGYIDYSGTMSQCYSAAAVSSTGAVRSTSYWFGVGGLVGYNVGDVSQCYSTGAVSSTGEKSDVGGLIGYNDHGVVSQCFWDTRNSGQAESAGGTGKTTADMQKASTFLNAGWDFVDETTNGTDDIWWILKGKKDYPRLWWESRVPLTMWKGSGTPEDPYQIATAEDLMLLGDSPEHYLKHFIMTADIDLNSNHDGPKVFYEAVIAPDSNSATLQYEGPPLGGVFDGNGHTISHLIVNGEGYIGLFGRMFGEVRNLGIVDFNITSSSRYVGALAGQNYGTVNQCYSTGTVGGNEIVGGLVGYNYYDATVSNCYSNSTASGFSVVSGLVGMNSGTVSQCYSTGMVSGNKHIGGLVGIGSSDTVTECFWDIETSGCTTSVGGIGKTTTEMQTISTFLDAGWDFVDETFNGTDDIWWIDEGQDYPRLWWEGIEQ